MRRGQPQGRKKKLHGAKMLPCGEESSMFLCGNIAALNMLRPEPWWANDWS